MTRLFERGYLHDFLNARVEAATNRFERMSEDEVLSRSLNDLVDALVSMAKLEPLNISVDPIGGEVVETSIPMRDTFYDRTFSAPGLRIDAIFSFTGDPDLLQYRPSTSILTRFEATVSSGTIKVQVEHSGHTPDPEATKRAIDREIEPIRQNAQHANRDVIGYNDSLASRLRPAVERRRKLLQNRRNLAGALGFPLTTRIDAPAPVPLRRTAMGVSRSAASSLPRQPYRDEPALTEAQYEDAIRVISSGLLSMERTPSVVRGKDEEALRDHILVMLNGTFEGAATGETFIKNGKTDILVRVEDRHVFVGECKWWRGGKAMDAAVDQLLGYLPWRDEKAALIVFIGNKDATPVFDKVERVIRGHSAFKRTGKPSSDGTKRRDFVLGHPDDPEREIQLAVLFAVLHRTC